MVIMYTYVLKAKLRGGKKKGKRHHITKSVDDFYYPLLKIFHYAKKLNNSSWQQKY